MDILSFVVTVRDYTFFAVKF